MKVKELIEKLTDMPQDSVVLYGMDNGCFGSIYNVSKGFNEYDGAVFLDEFVDEKDDECNI